MEDRFWAWCGLPLEGVGSGEQHRDSGAMGCQSAIAEQILAREGDYLLVLKANHPTAYAARLHALALGRHGRLYGYVGLKRESGRCGDDERGRCDDRQHEA